MYITYNKGEPAQFDLPATVNYSLGHSFSFWFWAFIFCAKLAVVPSIQNWCLSVAILQNSKILKKDCQEKSDKVNNDKHRFYSPITNN